MYIIPAIDLKDGHCVRLEKGSFDTVHEVAADALATAKEFESAGAVWLHMVDLDGALNGEGKNYKIIGDVIRATGLNVEVGGGIRDMRTLDMLAEAGAKRMIIGSAAVEKPDFVKEAVGKYGDKIAVGVDTLAGEVRISGWTKPSGIKGVEFAANMSEMGVKTFIFTDIERDGMLTGPPIKMLEQLKRTISANIIASGGVSSLEDIEALHKMDLFGAIVGKAVYTGDINLKTAIYIYNNKHVMNLFTKSELIPVVVQHASTNEVLMVAFSNREAVNRTIETKTAWFYSRSRGKLWNKGETSGNFLYVKEIYTDCDTDTLLYKCVPAGPVCHTGEDSCFYTKLWSE
ncbi:MAG: 1-(5-phosphoribosyl)-5-[(5-phosphoribosylamino)methylideneamino]imidazole-4-carboxamide isomerase [Oscillospiraceae bacterium]|jgi:phosphoribosylformimino-5-aminoimidazole carboxamide ribotide isomerase|nr:1-(5-phosphoribosyl)-5-[(5-phosphoribosylamino)methylideneamino]imidazole-4-carboxamide isomerase [Oscillospiraceae bacterium]